MIAEGTTTVEAELAAVENMLALAIRERDEARKMYCRAMAENGQESEEREIAEDLDWDCWKQSRK
jgi:hypothetical protein